METQYPWGFQGIFRTPPGAEQANTACAAASQQLAATGKNFVLRQDDLDESGWSFLGTPRQPYLLLLREHAIGTRRPAGGQARARTVGEAFGDKNGCGAHQPRCFSTVWLRDCRVVGCNRLHHRANQCPVRHALRCDLAHDLNCIRQLFFGKRCGHRVTALFTGRRIAYDKAHQKLPER